jgi:L-ascorbate metabolism protein UlaG (beta-lactamase superfamily)
VDPYISAKKAAHIDINSLQVDYIFTTHAHGDHILDVEAIAKKNECNNCLMLKLQVIMAQKAFNRIP